MLLLPVASNVLPAEINPALSTPKTPQYGDAYCAAEEVDDLAMMRLLCGLSSLEEAEEEEGEGEEEEEEAEN